MNVWGRRGPIELDPEPDGRAWNPMGWAGELVMAASILLLLVAALADLATRVIPDGIAIALAGLGLLSRAFAGLPSLAISVGLAALLFVLLVFAHARGILG